VKSIYPISQLPIIANCQTSWEFAAVGLEYSFMADRSRHQRQNAEDSHDFRYMSFDLLNSKSQLEIVSGRYKKDVVPK
jgi:hypothetical protein